MKSFVQLKKNLKKDFSGLSKIKVAVLGDSATQFLVQALKGMGYDHALHLDTWEADFNQIEQQILNPSSELYEFAPDIVIIFKSAYQLLDKYNKLPAANQATLASSELEKIDAFYNTISSLISAKVIFYNYNEIDDAIFGNYANQTPSSYLFQLRKLNYQLMQLATEKENMFVCDLSSIQNMVGKNVFFQPSLYVSTQMVLSLDVLPKVATRTVDLIKALHGKFKKCIILDLDHTTWGGIIGDDGIENIQIGDLGIGKAFTALQHWVKKLKNRGIIVTICSKNTESVAKEPFEKHPDMVLRLEDISVFRANWENKADNIRQIQRILNIGFDSMVFLDDNPFERNLVRQSIPEVLVPELPEDPANYLEYLYEQNLFETVSLSSEDKDRTKLYQIEAERVKEHQKFSSPDDFLKSLEMVSVVKGFDSFNTPRVAQLSQRSNQFNLRTIRYTEADITKMAESDDFATFSFTLEDKFGDNGLICVVVLEKQDNSTLFIDTWFMSCRVLKRGMENFVLNTLVEYAKNNGFSTLKGEYIPTYKNTIVAEHYPDLGFRAEGPFYILETHNYADQETFIKNKKSLV